MTPSYDADMFTDEAFAEPYGHYRALRGLGPVVWLKAHGVHAITRYEDVRAVLTDATTFCSGQGVGLNDVFNVYGWGSTLMSDGDDHRRLRNVIGRPLTPKALAELQPEAHIVRRNSPTALSRRVPFDAVPDLAEVLPTTWVPDLLGWPDESREKSCWIGRLPPSTGLDHPTNERAKRLQACSRWLRSPGRSL